MRRPALLLALGLLVSLSLALVLGGVGVALGGAIGLASGVAAASPWRYRWELALLSAPASPSAPLAVALPAALAASKDLGLAATVSLTVNFLSRANRRAAVDRAVAYANRRDACEHILGRTLRASDNVMKFCVHGGELNKSLAASIMGLDAEGLDARVKERKRERLRAEAEAEEEEGEGEEEGGGSE